MLYGWRCRTCDKWESKERKDNETTIGISLWTTRGSLMFTVGWTVWRMNEVSSFSALQCHTEKLRGFEIWDGWMVLTLRGEYYTLTKQGRYVYWEGVEMRNPKRLLLKFPQNIAVCPCSSQIRFFFFPLSLFDIALTWPGSVRYRITRATPSDLKPIIFLKYENRDQAL